MKRIHFKIAGIIALLTALVHLIAGQMDLVNPLWNSDLVVQQKGELTAVWHMVTVLLFMSSFYLLKCGFGKPRLGQVSLLRAIGILYVLMGLPFIIVSIYSSIFAPQWILLLPIGILTLLGVRKMMLDD